MRTIKAKQAWSGKADCLNCSLRSSALFNGLTEEDFEEFHQPIDQMSIKAGEILYSVNDPGRHLFTVRQGLLKLVQYLPDGSQRIVRLARSLDVLGLEILVSDKYEHEVIALQPTDLCRYPVDAVNHLSQRNPILHKDLMVRWKKALTNADAWLLQFSTGSARKRMINFLLHLVEGQENDECYLFSREDMGSILSITTETTSRMVSELKAEGLIKDKQHNFVQLDVTALQAETSK